MRVGYVVILTSQREITSRAGYGGITAPGAVIAPDASRDHAHVNSGCRVQFEYAFSPLAVHHIRVGVVTGHVIVVASTHPGGTLLLLNLCQVAEVSARIETALSNVVPVISSLRNGRSLPFPRLLGRLTLIRESAPQTM